MHERSQPDTGVCSQVSRRSFLKETARVAAVSLVPLHHVSAFSQNGKPATGATSVVSLHVDAAPGRVVNFFDLNQALGSSIDELGSSDVVDNVYTPEIIRQSLSLVRQARLPCTWITSECAVILA